MQRQPKAAKKRQPGLLADSPCTSIGASIHLSFSVTIVELLDTDVLFMDDTVDSCGFETLIRSCLDTEKWLSKELKSLEESM